MGGYVHWKRDGYDPTPQRGDRTCDCWVRLQSEVDRFGIRFGAHNPTCPVFKPTLDPVDNYHDAELRAQHEVGGPHGTRDNMPSRNPASPQ